MGVLLACVGGTLRCGSGVGGRGRLWLFFLFSSTISHRELVKSSACRLHALISWNMKMCFSAAVIIIQGTQAQTNPQPLCLWEKRECRKASLTAHVCISTTEPFEGWGGGVGWGREREMTCLDNGWKGGAKQRQRNRFPPQRSAYWINLGA